MIGIINKLLYILTLSPFEKVPLSTARPLDGPDEDDQITFLQLKEKNHEGRLLGSNENHLLDFSGKSSGGLEDRVTTVTLDDLPMPE